LCIDTALFPDFLNFRSNEPLPVDRILGTAASPVVPFADDPHAPAHRTAKRIERAIIISAKPAYHRQTLAEMELSRFIVICPGLIQKIEGVSRIDHWR
jgi:hypothetical protein